MVIRNEIFADNKYYSGVFHIHSKFSHDGKSSLSQIISRLRLANVDFCVMCDHFEDFDEAKFYKYLAEIESKNKEDGVLLIPGVEAEFEDLHVILFPVFNYEEICDIISQKNLSLGNLVKVLAHPTKYGNHNLIDLINSNQFDGLEVWNQQVDGNYTPSIEFLKQFVENRVNKNLILYFGCDLHNINYQISNILYIKKDTDLKVDCISRKLMLGEFLNYNCKTKKVLTGKSDTTDIMAWISLISSERVYQVKFLKKIRKVLKSAYNRIPKNKQERLNDIKNYIRSKI